ncbi:MAG: hypothetical protein GWP08_14720 [Nitrospiraceae bacterium]|nr:hypothetical protein [Nitrospiraceae bacterium]
MLGLLLDAAVIAMWLTPLGERLPLDRVDYGIFTGVPSPLLMFVVAHTLAVMAVWCAFHAGPSALVRLGKNRSCGKGANDVEPT